MYFKWTVQFEEKNEIKINILQIINDKMSWNKQTKKHKQKSLKIVIYYVLLFFTIRLNFNRQLIYNKE